MGKILSSQEKTLISDLDFEFMTLTFSKVNSTLIDDCTNIDDDDIVDIGKILSSNLSFISDLDF